MLLLFFSLDIIIKIGGNSYPDCTVDNIKKRWRFSHFRPATLSAAETSLSGLCLSLLYIDNSCDNASSETMPNSDFMRSVMRSVVEGFMLQK